jgi:hypothetical protein
LQIAFCGRALVPARTWFTAPIFQSNLLSGLENRKSGGQPARINQTACFALNEAYPAGARRKRRSSGRGVLWMTGFTDFATGERRADRRQRPRKSINPKWRLKSSVVKCAAWSSESRVRPPATMPGAPAANQC